MSRSLIYLVAGAPQLHEDRPIVRALQARADRFEFKIIHTGQHYDREMSDVFFDELGIPKPDYHLDAGGGSHATQTAKIMVAFEEICQQAPARLRAGGGRRTPPWPAPSTPRSSTSRWPTSRPACAAATCGCPRRSTARHRQHLRLVLLHRAGRRG